MKSWQIALSLMVLLVSLTGCENGWTTGGGVQDWNSSYNWVNFSGTYKGANNGILVTAYTSTSGKTNSVVEIVGNTGGGSGGSDDDTDAAKSESFALGYNATEADVTLRYVPIKAGSVRVVAGSITLIDNGSGTLSGDMSSTGDINYDTGALSLIFNVYPGASTFTVSYIQTAPSSSSGTTNYVAAGVLSTTPVLPGSLTIAVGDSYAVRDNGSGGLSGSGLTGTIDYSTGAWTIDFYGNTVPQNTDIVASYNSYSSGTDSSDKSGTSGKAIYSFVVAQEGENLSITDNNGCTYQGNMGSVRSTSGNASTPADGDTVIAQFTATGVSAAGMTVTIAGNFQGVVLSGDSDWYFTSRQMLGTWIEDGGKTGDVNGSASSVTISVDTTSSSTNSTT